MANILLHHGELPAIVARRRELRTHGILQLGVFCDQGLQIASSRFAGQAMLFGGRGQFSSGRISFCRCLSAFVGIRHEVHRFPFVGAVAASISGKTRCTTIGL